MLTRKSGIMALVLGAAVLAACEKKDGDIIIEPPPQQVTVTIAPDPVPNLNPGGTQQLVAIVTGTTNTAVTWSVLSGTSATVSATGLVTASTTVTGVTTIQAASQADPNAKDVVTVTVQAGGGTGPIQVTIGSITQFGTILPVNPGNVFGTIDITANLDVPPGVSGSIRVDIVDQAGNVVRADVCTQTFTSGSGADAAVAATVPVTVVCTFNTASLDANGVALLQNGTYRVRVRVLNAAGTTQLASAVSQPLVLNNTDVLNLTVRTDSMSGPAADQAGLSWRAGDVIVHIRPAIFSTTQASPLGAITGMNISLSTSGPGASWYATAPCLADNDTDGTSDWVDATPACPVATSTVAATQVAGQTNLWRAVFPRTSSIGAAGSGGVEDRAGLVVVPSGVLTVSGNNFPICTPAQAAALICGPATIAVNFPTATAGTVPVPITAQNPLRVDNLAPRVTSFNITGAFLGCGSVACFANANFAFAQGTVTAGVAAQSAASTAGFTNVDFGVDRQTANFAVGTSAQFTAGSGFATGVSTLGTASPALTETTLSTACPANSPGCLNPFVARVTVVDALGNDTIVFASTTGAATLALGSAQTLGFDITSPVVTSTVVASALKTYADNSVDQDDLPMTVTVTFRDTSAAGGAAPAGFGTTPLSGSVTLWNAANPGGTAAPGVSAVTCATSGPFALSTCTFTVADAAPVGTNPSGYYEIRSRVTDATVPGGNVSATDTLFYLDDETAPNVAGVTAPSSIPANQPATFTADMNDDVELGDLLATVGYLQGFFAHTPSICTIGSVTCAARQQLASYGLPLTSSLAAGSGNPGSVTYNPFIWSLESVTGAHLPFGDQAFAQAINFAVRDMAGMILKAPCPVPSAGDNAVTFVDSLADGSRDGHCRQRQNNNVAVNIAFANTLPSSFSVLTPGLAGFRIDSTSNNATPSSASAAPTGGTVTLRAEARGPQGTFPNPFSQVNFYVYDETLQRWLQIPGTGTTVPSDADVIGFRVWRTTLIVPATAWPVENTCKLEPEALPCVQAIQGSQIRAIGVNGGRGLLSNPVVLTSGSALHP